MLLLLFIQLFNAAGSDVGLITVLGYDLSAGCVVITTIEAADSAVLHRSAPDARR